MSPEPEDTPTGKPATTCYVDAQDTQVYLAALCDARMWPSTAWEKSGSNVGGPRAIGDMVPKLDRFREPEYNNLDKCECCMDVKKTFLEALKKVKTTQQDRLWAVCLGCCTGRNAEECRLDHPDLTVAQGAMGKFSTHGLRHVSSRQVPA